MACYARVLSAQILSEKIENGAIYPSFHRVQAVSLAIAVAVCQVAKQAGLVAVELPEADLANYFATKMYDPRYSVG